MAPIVVGVAEAARSMGTSPQRIRELIVEGQIATVPHLSTPKKLLIAVAELDRFASLGVTSHHGMRAVA